MEKRIKADFIIPEIEEHPADVFNRISEKTGYDFHIVPGINIKIEKGTITIRPDKV